MLFAVALLLAVLTCAHCSVSSHSSASLEDLRGNARFGDAPLAHTTSERLSRDACESYNGDFVSSDTLYPLSHGEDVVASAIKAFADENMHADILDIVLELGADLKALLNLQRHYPHMCGPLTYMLTAHIAMLRASACPVPEAVMSALDFTRKCANRWYSAHCWAPAITHGTQQYAAAPNLHPFLRGNAYCRPYVPISSLYDSSMAFARIRGSRTVFAENTCSICLEELHTTDTTVAVLPCAHVMCDVCAKRAIDERAICPSCRAPAFPDAHATFEENEFDGLSHGLPWNGVLVNDMSSQELVQAAVPIEEQAEQTVRIEDIMPPEIIEMLNSGTLRLGVNVAGVMYVETNPLPMNRVHGPSSAAHGDAQTAAGSAESSSDDETASPAMPERNGRMERDDGHFLGHFQHTVPMLSADELSAIRAMAMASDWTSTVRDGPSGANESRDGAVPRGDSLPVRQVTVTRRMEVWRLDQGSGYGALMQEHRNGGAEDRSEHGIRSGDSASSSVPPEDTDGLFASTARRVRDYPLIHQEIDVDGPNHQYSHGRVVSIEISSRGWVPNSSQSVDAAGGDHDAGRRREMLESPGRMGYSRNTSRASVQRVHTNSVVIRATPAQGARLTSSAANQNTVQASRVVRRLPRTEAQSASESDRSRDAPQSLQTRPGPGSRERAIRRILNLDP